MRVNFYFRSILYLLVFPLFVSASFAADMPRESSEEEAHQWLIDMNVAMRELSFQGNVAYLKNNQIETMQVTHAGYDGFEKEHIFALNGSMREVIREPDKVTCYFPESKTKITNYNRVDDHSLFSHLPKELKNYRGPYRFILAGSEKIAGRNTRKISITPYDTLRYGQKIWIDSESKLPLKYELFDKDGKVIEQMIFTSISLKQKIPPQYFKPQIDARDFKEINHLKTEREIGRSSWVFNPLPKGFEVTSHSYQPSNENRAGFEHIMLSDGLVSVSVYIEKNNQKARASKVGEFGGINTYMRIINDSLITVIGEVPGETVKLIGGAVRWQPQ